VRNFVHENTVAPQPPPSIHRFYPHVNNFAANTMPCLVGAQPTVDYICIRTPITPLCLDNAVKGRRMALFSRGEHA
jgi:hypothetical protein